MSSAAKTRRISTDVRTVTSKARRTTTVITIATSQTRRIATDVRTTISKTKKTTLALASRIAMAKIRRITTAKARRMTTAIQTARKKRGGRLIGAMNDRYYIKIHSKAATMVSPQP